MSWACIGAVAVGGAYGCATSRCAMAPTGGAGITESIAAAQPVVVRTAAAAAVPPASVAVGTVAAVVIGGTKLRSAPGKFSPSVLNADGKPAQLCAGQSVVVSGEGRDKKGQLWFQVRRHCRGGELQGWTPFASVRLPGDNVAGPDSVAKVQPIEGGGSNRAQPSPPLVPKSPPSDDAPASRPAKLTGPQMWAQIGAPKYVVAPMVDQSELAFRMLCRKYGATLAYTPMFHARLYCEDHTYADEFFTTCAADRPLIVQFCGNDPAILLQAARAVQDRCDFVDLNLGCPQAIARRGNYGAFLADSDLPRVLEIVRTLHAGLTVPISCKIRIRETLEETLSYALALQEAGCQLLGVHGRTRACKRNGLADWDAIKAVKQALHIPVIANGNIRSLADCEACLAHTGADAIMSAETLLENPALFSHPPAAWPRAQHVGAPLPSLPPSSKEPEPERPLMISPWWLAKEYCEFVRQYPAGAGISCVRAHIFKILHVQLAQWTDLRAKLASGQTQQPEIFALVEEVAERMLRLGDEAAEVGQQVAGHELTVSEFVSRKELAELVGERHQRVVGTGASDAGLEAAREGFASMFAEEDDEWETDEPTTVAAGGAGETADGMVLVDMLGPSIGWVGILPLDMQGFASWFESCNTSNAQSVGSSSSSSSSLVAPEAQFLPGYVRLELPFEDRYGVALLTGTRNTFIVRRCHGDSDCLTLSYSSAPTEVSRDAQPSRIIQSRINHSTDAQGRQLLWVTWLRIKAGMEEEEEIDVEAASVEALAQKLAEAPYGLRGLGGTSPAAELSY